MNQQATDRRTLITGGTGFLGRRLVRRLADRGEQVVATSRDAERARETLGPGVECFEWDYRTQTFPAAALDGVQTVYHLMGEGIATGRWTAKKKKALRESRILSTRNLVAALHDGVTDFLSASAIGIYPGNTHAPFDEESRLPEPDSFMTQLCTDWEEAAAAARTPARRQASLRIGLVLGETGMLGPLVPLYRLGLGGPLGDGKQLVPWVHVDDLVRMLEFVREERDLEGPVNLVGPAPVPLGEFSASLASVLRRPHLFRVPAAAVRLALGEASALLLSSFAIQPTLLEKAGFAFQYSDHRSALEHVIAEHY